MMNGDISGLVLLAIIVILFLLGTISIIIDIIICKDFSKNNTIDRQEYTVEYPTYYFRKKQVPELLTITEDFFNDEIEYEN